MTEKRKRKGKEGTEGIKSNNTRKLMVRKERCEDKVTKRKETERRGRKELKVTRK